MNRLLLCTGVLLAAGLAGADPWLAPGDLTLRSDLHALADAGVLHSPITTWPLAWDDIAADIDSAQPSQLDEFTRRAGQRVRERARLEMRTHASRASSRLALAERPAIIRTFENTPREKAEAGGTFMWTGGRVAIKLQGTAVSDPFDDESFRLDGSYVGVALGNWMLSVGYPERWWGPGWDGSLILSTNARPTPQLSINRNNAAPFRIKWLRWIGPWSLTSFMGRLDDERFIEDALLFGVRATAKPLDGLEIGLSRTAQWCGKGRLCDAGAFFDLLAGHDNTGVNVPVGEEPGNQLGGIDVRWASPFGDAPYALYLQWIGEDTRQGGPQIGSWLREAGVEFWSPVFGGRWQQRTHFEAADTVCREGGIGTGKKKYNCAYEHGTFVTGYRYEGRSIGHGIDGDGNAYTMGSTLTREDGRSWNLAARYLELNRNGTGDPMHSLSPTPKEITELSISHTRSFDFGVLRAGVGYSRLRDELSPNLHDDSFFGWIELTRSR